MRKYTTSLQDLFTPTERKLKNKFMDRAAKAKKKLKTIKSIDCESVVYQATYRPPLKTQVTIT